MKNRKLQQKRRKGKQKKIATFNIPDNAAGRLLLSFYNQPVLG